MQAWDDLSSGIITSAPETKPLTTLDQITAVLLALEAKAYTRDLCVVSGPRWDRILQAASPELRAELSALRSSGSIIVSAAIPDDDHVYRIAPHLLQPGGRSWPRPTSTIPGG